MQTYSFKDTYLTINGKTIEGYDEGDDVITLRRLNDNSSHILSADGIMTVSYSPDRSGEIIFRVNQASDINGYLSSLVTLQESTGIQGILIDFQDSNGGDIIKATAGYIPRPADIVRGLNTQAQEWRIVVEELVMAHRGGQEII